MRAPAMGIKGLRQVIGDHAPEAMKELDLRPVAVPSVGAAWASLAQKLGIAFVERGKTESAGYPKPWQPAVENGDRNKAMYLEAHKLREAGLPITEALALLQVRFESSYEPGDTAWPEMEATIRSAYRKGLPTQEALVSWNL